MEGSILTQGSWWFTKNSSGEDLVAGFERALHRRQPIEGEQLMRLKCKTETLLELSLFDIKKILETDREREDNPFSIVLYKTETMNESDGENDLVKRARN